MAKGFFQSIRNAFSGMTATSRFVTPETRGQAEDIQARVEDIKARLTERHERILQRLQSAPDLAYRPPGATPTNDKANQAGRQTEKYNRSLDRLGRVEKAILDTLEKNQFRADGAKLKASLTSSAKDQRPGISRDKDSSVGSRANSGTGKGRETPNFSEEAVRHLAERLAQDPVAQALAGPATRVFNKEVDKNTARDGEGEHAGERGGGAGETAADNWTFWTDDMIKAYERDKADEIARAEKGYDQPDGRSGAGPASGSPDGHDVDPGRTL